jgi:hypothetical protein
MATPFLVLKTLTRFRFKFIKVLSHFRELVLRVDSKALQEVILSPFVLE